MSRLLRLPLSVAALSFSMGGAVPLAGQNLTLPSALTVVPRTRGVFAADPGNTVSAVFLIANHSTADVKVVPRVVAPAGWSAVTGALPFALGAGESDTWVVSLAVPAYAARGQYVVPVAATLDGGETASVLDSVVVEVKERREISVMLLDHPPFVITGDAYRVSFMVRNSGNGPTRVRLAARSSRGAAPSTDAAELTLSADSSRTIAVRVPTAGVGAEAADDVLEMEATDEADTSSHATASARTTIVPRPGTSIPFVTVPAQLVVRAAGSGAGVAPFELTGAGRLRPDGPEQAEFVFRGATGPYSPYGEREEYRVGVTAPGYRVRVGDNFFGLSPLTNIGQEGFGGGGELTRSTSGGNVTVGAYSERVRFLPESVDETGGAVTFRPPASLLATSQLSVTAVDRAGGPFAGQIASSSLSLEPAKLARIDAEYAQSRGPSGPGSAESLHLSNSDSLGGVGPGAAAVQYDFMHMTGSESFAGSVRAATHDYGTLGTQPWHDFQLSGSASSHESTVLDSRYRLRTANVALVYAGGLSLGYVFAQQDHGASACRDSLLIASMPGAPASGFSSNGESALRMALSAGDATQRGIVANVQRAFRGGRAWAGTEAGTTHQLAGGLDRAYHELELGSVLPLGPHSLGLYGELYDGGSITRGPAPLTMLGGNTNVQIGRSTRLAVFGSGSLRRSGRAGFSQLDARLSQALATGATISLRARATTGQWDPRANARAVFLEYSLPLRVPVGLERPPGRVHGRIVSSETGLGVSGALVRLGSQAAVTDADGRVSFTGLRAGQYRVSLSQDMAMANSAIEGNPVVSVDSIQRDPATFRLAVAPAAVVRGTVHHWVFAKTAIGNEPDSLVDAGPMPGVVVLLTSDGDTLYRTTDASGAFQFAERSPKHWKLKVVSEAPARSHFDPQETDIKLAPGDVFQATVRLLPMRREVRIIDGGDSPLLIPSAPTSANPKGRGAKQN